MKDGRIIETDHFCDFLYRIAQFFLYWNFTIMFRQIHSYTIRLSHNTRIIKPLPYNYIQKSYLIYLVFIVLRAFIPVITNYHHSYPHHCVIFFRSSFNNVTSVSRIFPSRFGGQFRIRILSFFVHWWYRPVNSSTVLYFLSVVL